MRYSIRVHQDDSNYFNTINVTTDRGKDMARLFAFLMDGGAGTEYEDDIGVMALAKIWTTVE